MRDERIQRIVSYIHIFYDEIHKVIPNQEYSYCPATTNFTFENDKSLSPM